ncbi:hypothetical protein PAXRUDRAFT_189216 [Paxillus rubicundulus Ve08.2h10]|uniref:Ras GEF n=1 Tax=Paxillus rubicundulus Ve08.2h10 TaxID=930991 RepID=A0A0D0EDG3_9AGAM|nr:hypothetical protein PAXRUDRAFT_189216 [Paxillus rubicundulus Ve08.2h10]
MNMLNVTLQAHRQPLRISTDTSPFRTRLQPALSGGASGSPSPTNLSLTDSGTTPSTGNPDWFVCHVLCMYDFESPDPDHLSFDKDEVLSVVKQEESGWWAAMRPQGDCIGWIPSSFVELLTEQMVDELQSAQDESKVWASQEAIHQPHEDTRELEDSPSSASHNPWVPVPEDFKAPSLQLVTPTDLVPRRYPQAGGKRQHSYDSFVSVSDEEQSPSSVRDVRVPALRIPQPPPTPQSPAFHPTHKFTSLPDPHPLPLKQQALQATDPLPSRQSGAASPRPLRPRGLILEDQASLLHSLLEADQIDNLDIIDSPVIKESLLAVDWTPTAQRLCRDNGSRLHAKSLPASPRLATQFTRYNTRSIPAVSENDVLTWDPDDVAEQFSVLMHDLYAVIRPRECLDWVEARTLTDVAHLRRFFDVHDQIAIWVQKSVLSYDNLARRTEALDFWIQVSEKCRSLRNFDTSSAIISGLSSVTLSSFQSTWAHCTFKQTFDMLHKTYGAANNFTNLMIVMATIEGPSVPFIGACLESMQEIGQERLDNLPPHLDHEAIMGLRTKRRRMANALATMLRHQTSSYFFGVTQFTRRFIDQQLEAVASLTDN